MLNPKISVIVPVYNTEKYLEKCVESIINQTYENLEIILVDDGSTDGSGAIIDGFAQRDGRIIVVHKENGGAGSARNSGLDMATGSYIGFVDSDDWLECGMYQALVDAMEDELLDMVICNYSIDLGEVHQTMKNRKCVSEDVFDTQQLLRYVFQRDDYKGVTAYVVNKIFRRELVINEGIRFDGKYLIGEDVLWFSKVSLKCKRIRYIDEMFYHYVQRGESMVHSQELEKQTQRIEVYLKVINLFEMSEVDAKTIVYVKRFLAYHAMNIAKLAYGQGHIKELKYMQQIMDQYKAEYIMTNEEYPDRVREFLTVLNRELA
ncbi:MAG: glycosyltransferase [Lachnospiraceae bacterium]|nr:glycosyltransferase [Lachnospiraceae bacterium]